MAHEKIHASEHSPGGPDPIDGTYQVRAEKGSANGYAGLGADGKVPSAQLPAPQAGGVPTGVIVLWHGLLAAIPEGWTLCDGNNGTPDLRSKFVKGAAAGADPGATGGSATHTHDDHPALVHAGSAVADHAALQHAGAAVANHGSHTHTYSQVPNHTHPVQVTDPGHTHLTQRYPTATGGSSGFTIDTSMSGTLADNTLPTKVASTGISAAAQNPDGGVAQGTTDGPSAALAHSVTQPNDHPAQSHNVTQPSQHAAQAHVAANHEPAFYAIAYIMKT